MTPPPHIGQQTALITGGTGFVGSRMARHLVDQGWKVSILHRPSSSLAQLLPIRDSIQTFSFDGDSQSLVRYMKQLQPDVVFHFATLFVAQHRPEDIHNIIDTNITFGTQLLDAMAHAHVTRFVNAGTVWQHYLNAAYCPVNLYAATKQAFEDILAYYCDARNLRAVTLTLFDTYGPEDPRGKLLSLLHNAALQNKPLLMSPGQQQLDLLYIDDVTSAFHQAAELTANAIPSHQNFAVTAPERVTLRQLVALMEQTLNLTIPVTFGGRPYREREVMIPWTHGIPLPNWTPATTLAQGLKKTFPCSTTKSPCPHSH